MRKYLILFLFIAVNVFAQDFFAPFVWKRSGNNLIPTDATVKVPNTVIDGLYTGYDPTTTFEIMEDFVGNTLIDLDIGKYSWRRLGVGGVNSQAATATNFGNIQMYTDVNVSGHLLCLAQGNYSEFIYGTPPNMTITMRVKRGILNSGTFIRLGVGQIAIQNDPQDGIFFRGSPSGAYPNYWIAVTRKSNIETITNTGVDLTDGGNFRTFRITTDGSGAVVKFYIDGVLVATHTTNIPTLAITPTIQIEETQSSSGSDMIIDYYHLKITGLNR